MLKRLLTVIGILIAIIGIIVGHDVYRISQMKKKFASFAPPPATVTVASVAAKTWQPQLSAIGTLQAMNGVNVSAEVPGTVMAILFQSGQMVQKDQPLVQLDDSTDKENLLNAQAQMQLKQVGFEQQQALLAEHATSKIALDEAKAGLASAEADVENAKNAIAKKLIRAPFAGKIGIRKINIGQYITPGLPMVSLQSMDPLYVQFYLPEQNINAIAVEQAITITADSLPGQSFTGKITAINSEIDPQTRNIEVQATVPNSAFKLMPGIFVNLQIQLPTQQQVIVIPETAVTYSLYGDAVFVVHAAKDKEKNATVEQRFVTVGMRQGDAVSIIKGLQSGDQVVTSGQQKLHNGDPININNTVQV